jgi:hypothetical protein
LFLTIDESSAMTEAIHQKQREAETLEGLIREKKGEKLIRKHQTAQRMLKPLAVVNPFTPYLSYPSASLRTRRDHKKYLALMRAIAFLYQYQRETKFMEIEGEMVEIVEVILDDIAKANKIANEVLGQSLDELAKPSRTLLNSIFQMVQEFSLKQNVSLSEVFFTRRDVREYTNWTDWQVKAHIRQLEEMEYVYVRMGARGKEYAYALNYQGQAEENPSSKCFLNLTPIEEIKKMLKKAPIPTTPPDLDDPGKKN